MLRKKYAIKLLAVLCLFFLSGCVSLIQEINVHEDGSGSLNFSLGVDSSIYPQFLETMPEGFTFENLLSGLMLDENVTDVVQTQYEENGKNWETIQLSISDISAVFNGGRRIGPGMITIAERNGSYVFTQFMDLGSSNVVIPGVNLLNLAGTSYSVRLVTPQVLDTNGLHRAAGVSTWDVPLSEFLQGGSSVNLRSEYLLEPYEGFFIPWEVFFPYVVIGFIGLGGISILLVILINTAKKREDKLQLRL